MPPQDDDETPADATAAASTPAAWRLLAEGALDEADAALRNVRAQGGADLAELGLLAAAVQLQRAMAELEAVVGEPAAAPAAGAAAVELLARLLALRGDPDAAADVWRRGVEHRNAELAQEVRERLRRGFPRPEDGAAAGDPWWEDYLAAAVAEDTLPLLAGELFVALTRLHAELATAHLRQGRPARELRASIEAALRIPAEYVWGDALDEDFAERLRRSAGGARLRGEEGS